MSNAIAPRDPQIDPADGAMVDRRVISVPASSLSADASSDLFYVGDKGSLRATLAVVSRSGTTPTLDVAVMTCDTPDGTFYSAGAFAQKTAAGSERKTFAVDRWVRFDFDLGGTTPVFNTGIEAEAV